MSHISANRPAVTGQVTGPPTSPHDTTLRQLKDQVGNRSVGGKISTWMRNKAGMSTGNSGTMTAFRSAIQSRVGSEASTVIFKELGLSPKKALTERQAQAAIDIVDRFVADRTNKTDMTSDKRLSDSALALRASIAGKMGGAPADNRFAANQIMGLLKLDANQPVTKQHIEAANRFAESFESARGTPLFDTLGPKGFPINFKLAWEAVGKSGNDPRAQLLNGDELVALHVYTRPDFTDINSDLRGGNPSDRTLAVTNAVVSGLAKLPPYQGQCVRGADLPQKVDGLYQRGAVISDRAFSSSSSANDQSFDGAHQMMIFSKSGKDISFLSMKPEEQEILFPPGTQFKVLNRSGDVAYGTIDPNADPVKGAGGVSKWGQAFVILAEV